MEKDKIVDWIKECKVKGYDDAQIRNTLQQQGYPQDKINSLILQAAARRFSKPFLVGIYLGSFFIIILLIVVGIFAVKVINSNYERTSSNHNINFDSNTPSTSPATQSNPDSPVLPSSTQGNSNPNSIAVSNVAVDNNREKSVISMLDLCVNSTFDTLMKSPMGTKDSANLPADYVAPDGILFLPKYKFQVPENAATTIFKNYLSNQVPNCMRSNVSFDVRQTNVAVSITDTSISINTTVIDARGTKYSSYRTENIR
jgi:hypothetical protein